MLALQFLMRWPDVERLGQKGELVGVKKGYARNFLLPNQKAVLPSPANLKAYEEFTSVRRTA